MAKKYQFTSCRWCGRGMGDAMPLPPEVAQRFRCNKCGVSQYIPGGADPDDDREMIQSGDYRYYQSGK